jgi:hypothetical protein
MSEFNFKSQICTNREQSERLLALGLKKETADCFLMLVGDLGGSDLYTIRFGAPYDGWVEGVIPAWSLHRLIEMMPNNIHKYNDIADLSISNELVQYRFYDVDYNHDVCLEHFNDGTLYDNLIDCIEWLIKEGNFNKEYLV